ncbi:MAG TPA: FKBP-type peptidyl-prolyl cis-trans isomerase [Prolixibacteraceae bacterium]|nr:FKBP-type peptidyl-prolyl cis-trans isomerase [Prolixibacteraceae bacterium]
MKNRIVNFLMAIAVIFAAVSCDQSGSVKEVKLETDADSVGYAIGVLVGANNNQQIESAPGGGDINTEAMASAFRSAILDEETAITREEADAIVRRYFEGAGEEEAQSNLEEGNAFLEENKQREGVQVTESGLQYEILEEGTGATPGANDQVKVHYHGTLIDGTVFDSSVERGEPATFGVSQVIPGWTEALLMMKEGSKWKIYLPSLIAYGERGAGQNIGPNTTLIFEVELLEIVKK